VGWCHSVVAREPTMSLSTFVVPDGEEAPSPNYKEKVP
jgi:hypothetical protein